VLLYSDNSPATNNIENEAQRQESAPCKGGKPFKNSWFNNTVNDINAIRQFASRSSVKPVSATTRNVEVLTLKKEVPFKYHFMGKNMIDNDEFQRRCEAMENKRVMPKTHLWFNSLVKDVSDIRVFQEAQKRYKEGDMRSVVHDDELVRLNDILVSPVYGCCENAGMYQLDGKECCWMKYRRTRFMEALISECQRAGWVVHEYEVDTQVCTPSVCEWSTFHHSQRIDHDKRYDYVPLRRPDEIYLYSTISITPDAMVWQYGDRVVMAMKPTYHESYLRIRDNKATRQDIWRCKDLLLHYDLGYKHELVVLNTIYNRPYIQLQHYMYSECENILVCDPLIIHQTPTYVLLRSRTGYQAFGEDDGSLVQIIEDMPYQRFNPINYRMEYEVCDKDQLLKMIDKDLTLLNDESVYRQLMYCIKCHYKIQLVMGYLNMSHFMLYNERPATRCVVLAGKPGVGKSHAVTTYCKDTPTYYYRHDPRTKNFFSGYRGQSVVVIDDLGHYSIEEWKLIVQLISTTPVYVPMVETNYIGRIPFVSSTILITTNCLHRIKELPIETQGALGRRMDVIEMGTKCVYRLYKATQRLYVDICEFDRSYIGEFLARYNQDSIYVVPQKDWDKVIALGLTIGTLIFCTGLPYIRTVERMYLQLQRFIRPVYTMVSSILGVCIDQEIIYHHNWIPRSLKRAFSRLSKIQQHLVRMKLDSCYSVVGDAPVCNTEKLAGLIAEHGLLSNDVHSEVYPQTLVCGKMVDTPDLRPYLKRGQTVRTYESTGCEDIYLTQEDVDALPGLCDIVKPYESTKYPWVLLGSKPKQTVIRKPAYMLVGLPDNLKQYYKEGVPFERFAPLSDAISYTVDESEYKPTSIPTVHVRYSAVNKLIHSRGLPRTQKRREQRKRQKLSK